MTHTSRSSLAKYMYIQQLYSIIRILLPFFFFFAFHYFEIVWVTQYVELLIIIIDTAIIVILKFWCSLEHTQILASNLCKRDYFVLIARKDTSETLSGISEMKKGRERRRKFKRLLQLKGENFSILNPFFYIHQPFKIIFIFYWYYTILLKLLWPNI